MVRLIPALFFSLLVASCTRNGAASESRDTGTPTPSPAAASPTQESEWKAVEKLEAQARALARVDGCSASSDCGSAAVGRKACGSPRDYLVYCTKTTDVNALKAKLDEVIKAETAFNQKYSVVSTCEMRLAPVVDASGGSCTVK